MKKIESPILLITFNRPGNTRKVFDSIRKARVKKLYVANDGPRKNNKEDRQTREEIKKIVSDIDWDCQLFTKFQDKNLGCGWGPASAISWAFENEDRLIILEDDCVPSMPFYGYCHYLLEKYKNDTRIWMISGRSHQVGSKHFDDKDYIFTHYGHSWGWATWKRCWIEFDMDMVDWPNFEKAGGAVNVLATEEQGRFYNQKYTKLYADKKLYTHAWDFQANFSRLKNNGLCIVPAENLIQNIGHLGTHSNKKNQFHEISASSDYQVIKEPKFVMISKEYEKLHFDTHIKKLFGSKPMYKRIINKIIKLMLRFRA